MGQAPDFFTKQRDAAARKLVLMAAWCQWLSCCATGSQLDGQSVMGPARPHLDLVCFKDSSTTSFSLELIVNEIVTNLDMTSGTAGDMPSDAVRPDHASSHA